MGRPLFVYCPECGLRFDRRNAFATLEKFGERLFFCSEKCANKRWKKNAND